jgi:hypothetical protein
MKIRYKNVSLTVSTNDDGDIRYIHPISGQPCETLEQAFAGWSEQDESLNEQWDELKELVASGACDEHIRDDVDYIA